MTASHRAGEITFYEELGVAPDASPGEVRDAFRCLVRLLHPDQQTDPLLKDIAEKQMRKLNRIHAVLSDPERRRQYDNLLDGEDADPPVAIRPFFRREMLRPEMLRPEILQKAGKVALAASILLGVGLLIWWLTAETAPGPQSRVRDQSSPVEPVAASLPPSATLLASQESMIASLRSDLRAVTMERDAAIYELARLRGAGVTPPSTNPGAPEPDEIRAPAIAAAELPATPRLPALTPPARVESPVHKLAGFWFYAKPPLGQHNKNESLYPPEYIEATISEENGMILGKYRSRFEIVDRAISPDVNFTFTGPSGSGTQMTFPWIGGGGAKGDLTIKLLSDNSLRIDWSASDLGTQQGLGAGTAVLTRRIE